MLKGGAMKVGRALSVLNAMVPAEIIEPSHQAAEHICRRPLRRCRCGRCTGCRPTSRAAARRERRARTDDAAAVPVRTLARRSLPAFAEAFEEEHTPA